MLDVTSYLSALAVRIPEWTTICMVPIFPFVAYAAVSPRVPSLAKPIPALVYLSCGATALAFTSDVIPIMVSHVLTFGYFALVACLVWAAAGSIRRARFVTPPLVFGTLCVLCVLVPGMALPSPAPIVAVPLGWELALSAYSLIQDGHTDGKALRFEDGLFFLLVNPTLVYPERGEVRRAPGFHKDGLSRCLLGALAIGFQLSIFTALELWPGQRPVASASISSLTGGLAFVAYYGLLFLAAYSLYSGIASLQIGAMRVFGYHVHERYALPLCARNPADFWRRWNRYVGSWARRYLFVPTATKVRRRLSGTWAAPASVSVAVVVTFVAVGIYHDFGAFAEYRSWPLGGVLAFSLHASALLGWIAVTTLFARLWPGLRAVSELGIAATARGVSRACFIGLVLATAWITLPSADAMFMFTAREAWDSLSHAW